MGGDPRLELNHRGNTPAGPDVAPEAIRFGATVQAFGQAGELRIGQPTAGPRGWSMAEGFRTTLSATRHPLADRALAHAQGCGDLALRPALLCEVPGLQAPSFLPSVR
jgi:hypothetical protein